MSYPFRDRSRLSDRYRGKTADELLNELKSEIDQDRDMFFDTPFPRSTGFPFDDMSRGRQDIRSHLEDLAQRHPEFADQLRCPPWGGEMGGPSHGTTWRSARQGSTGDEPSFSQSKEPEQTEEPGPLRGRPRENNLPTHGLRNTVDMGQQQHEAEQDKTQRGQRSMSAPPSDNRASDQPQRFVSRIDINPLNPGAGEGKPPAAPKQQQSPSPQKPATKPPQQGASNVRHIPIFVEGRDEPVVPKNVDSAPDRIFAERVIPSQAAPPQAPFPERVIPTQAGFPSERTRRSQSPFAERTIPTQSASSPHASFGFNRPSQFTSQHQFQPQPKCSKPQQPAPDQTPPHQPQPQAATPPPQRKAPEPKDPLSLVQVVQKDVDELTIKVEAYSGNSRKDKDYIYLDEMLTRNLLKLDNIETEGKENVRQARRAVIRDIQKCINILESKVPLPEESMEVIEGSDTVASSEEMNESVQNEENTTPNVPKGQEIEQTVNTEVPEEKLKENVEPVIANLAEPMNADLAGPSEQVTMTEASEQINSEEQSLGQRIQESSVSSTEGQPAPTKIEEEMAMFVEPPPTNVESEEKVEQISQQADSSEPPCVEMAEAISQSSEQEMSSGKDLAGEGDEANPKTDMVSTEAKPEVAGESAATDLTMEVDPAAQPNGVKSDTVPSTDGTNDSGDKQPVTDSPSKGKKGGKKGTAKSKKSLSQAST